MSLQVQFIYLGFLLIVSEMEQNNEGIAGHLGLGSRQKKRATPHKQGPPLELMVKGRRRAQSPGSYIASS